MGLGFSSSRRADVTVRVDAGGPVSDTASAPHPPFPTTYIAVTVKGSLLRHKQSSEVMLLLSLVLYSAVESLNSQPCLSSVQASTSGHAARMPLRSAIAVLVGTLR